MKILAHRGDSGTAPENTLAAFQQAVAAGADGVECDVHLSADGVPVVIHDEFLGRTVVGSAAGSGPDSTAGLGPVSAHSAKDLRAMDAGGWFDPRFSGEGVPSLAEVLELLRPTGLLVNIELKTGRFPYPGLVANLVAQVAGQGLEARVVISSFNHLTLVEVGALAPSLECAALVGAHLVEPWTYVKEHGFQALHPVKHACNAALVDACHKLGLAVRPWTVNDQPRALELFELGVDGIVTNHPGPMREWHDAWRQKNATGSGAQPPKGENP